ncbi:lipid II:glycine glycyltransferase FemX [Pseudomonadota bacterium]
MIIREPLDQERNGFDIVATHPLQSWAWGEFRKTTGVDVERLALYDGQHITKSFQISIHKTPHLKWKLGYLPRSLHPDDAQLFALKTAAEKFNLVFVKNEPNIYSPITNLSEELSQARDFLTSHNHQPGRPMFTKYSFILDLAKSEEDLLAGMKPKTRYNVNLAQKKGVTVSVDNSQEAFEEYIKLWKKTINRQAFYSHNETYHRNMWKHMSKAGIAHLLKATYQEQTLGVWIVFIFNHVLYYPYGASSRHHKDVMANNLLAWEAIKFGQSKGCSKFDMWGSLGPEADKQDSWYGFHRFKEGYGGKLVEYVGTYDFVIDPRKYQIFTKVDSLRWKFLKFRTHLPF